MKNIKEMQGEFLIRDNGTVFNCTDDPCVVFDRDCGTLHKIGGREMVVAHFDELQSLYRAHGMHKIANDITFMELPKDQKEIDRVFNNTGYVKSLYEKSIDSTHKKVK